ncbi:YwiC-like family protein [Brevibacillus choshinensis]|uniref:YwiC-like family protein n=1 Tax=Brevibacillus choshinensis TaxID=54911 RepID=A0ABX7FSP0_BRECH|nr:YwiC-like family protein [Brevibacillus choshinensis]QRG67975.1 YwiC-like family protein [Brevibacillus choshinensis]
MLSRERKAELIAAGEAKWRDSQGVVEHDFCEGHRRCCKDLLQLLAGLGLLCGFIVVNAGLVFLRQPKLGRQVLQTMLLFGAAACMFLAYPLGSSWQAFWLLAVVAVFSAASIWFIPRPTPPHKSETTKHTSQH